MVRIFNADLRRIFKFKGAYILTKGGPCRSFLFAVKPILGPFGGIGLDIIPYLQIIFFATDYVVVEGTLPKNTIIFIGGTRFKTTDYIVHL
jgi:hypothetical protein